MADKQITQLSTEITAPAGDDELVIQRASDSVTGKIKVSNLEPGGWAKSGETWDASATGSNNGGKVYQFTISGDKTDKYSQGMRVKWTRGTAAGSQSLDLESSSSQYASLASGSVSGITFTDDFTIEAWVKLESYTNNGTILRRGTGAADGFFLRQSSTTGQIEVGAILSSGNSRARVTDYILPLNKWVHVAAYLDMSGNTGKVWINGEEVSTNANNSGTATSLTNNGDLAIGARAAPDHYFDGKIKDVRLWSDIRTQAEIQDNMNKELVGNETNLVGYWKLEGDYTDETSNANDLTASGSPVFDTADSPFNAIEYAIIKDVTESGGTTTVTNETGDSYNIPPESITTGEYSTQFAPLGFVDNNGKGADNTIVDKSVQGKDLGVPVAFRVRLSAAQGGVLDVTATTVEFDTVDYDYGNNFNTSTYTFTVPYDGVYSFKGFGRYSGTSINDGYIELYVNGSTTYQMGRLTRGASGNSIQFLAGTYELELSANDTVVMRIYGNDTAASFTVSDTDTYFAGHLVGRTD